MSKVTLTRPALICFYGYPGAGKSYISRNLQSALSAALVSADRIRDELFRNPRRDNQENAIVTHLMNYMTEEFLAAGTPVIYDANSARTSQRRYLMDMARRHKAAYVLLWLQIDIDSAFNRLKRHEPRATDTVQQAGYDKQSFDHELATMQNPKDEDYLVLSGKHAFSTQKSAIFNRLYQMGLIDAVSMQQNVAEPGLVNLVPSMNAGRVDMTRRNINIR